VVQVSRTKYYPYVVSLKYSCVVSGDSSGDMGVWCQGISQVLRLSTVCTYKALSLSTEHEAAWWCDRW
jgi:hypothetical protein